MTDETKEERKRKRKEAELRETLANAESAEITLAKSLIELERLKDTREIERANPDLTGQFGLNHSIGEVAVENTRARLLSFARRNPGAPISLAITSPGGSVFDGLHLYATLRDLSDQGHEITTIASGFAASMGAVLLQAGDHRVMGAESLVMIHEVSSFAIGKAGEIKRESEFLDRLTRQMCAIWARRSPMSADEVYDKIQNNDWWIWPDEALELGFVDEVRSV